MLFSTAIFASAFAGLVAASTNHTVMVGPGALKFVPPNLAADVGDMVTFVFAAKNHSVTQSSFKDPCTPLAGGFDSGFVATPANATNMTTYSIMVTDAKPKWVFCAQANNVTGNHCHKGMVFSINPTPAGTNTSADAYMQKAMALGANDPAIPAAAPTGSAASSAAAAGATDASGSSNGGASAASGASSSSSFLFPSGTDSGAAAGATPNGGSASASGSFLLPSGASASATDPAATDSGASAAADQTSSSAASVSSTAPPSAKSSGEKSVARRSMAVLAAVGALVVLVL